MPVSPELLEFFKKRLADSYALGDAQKSEILSRVHELTPEQIGEVLDILVQYERILEKDSRGFIEGVDRSGESEDVQRLMDAFTF